MLCTKLNYKSDIFLVRAATKRGATVEFTPDYSRLTTKEGTTFELQDKEKLYFLNKTVDSDVSNCATLSINKVSTGNTKKNNQTLQQWHNI